MTIPQDELQQLMTESASDAAKVSQEEFGITLDFSADSIALVDDMLLAFVDKYKADALEDKHVFTLCNVFGAYIGEIFRNLVGGTWRYDTSDPKAPYVLLEYGERSYAFAGICYERLVNDSAVSVKDYFDQALSNSTQ
ncbi:hypothetical protein [Aestuariibacter salexigens]|uniref:hypothetical protein n=1 Tax=Aestuariibacter salexigens TaxID=226010 RepID=UPI000411CDB8|nr:hypothetical protein [Aestuariibacter salexigens]